MVTGHPIKPNIQTWFKLNQCTPSMWICYTGHVIIWFKVTHNKFPFFFKKFERVAQWDHTPKLRENWNPLG